VHGSHGSVSSVDQTSGKPEAGSNPLIEKYASPEKIHVTRNKYTSTEMKIRGENNTCTNGTAYQQVQVVDGTF